MKANQLKFGVILSYVSIGINMLAHLVYTPIMIQLLGQSEYGLYTLVGSVISYLSLFNLGFTGAYLRFYSRFQAQQDKTSVARLNGMFMIIFLVMSAAALGCGMLLTQFTPQLFGDKLTVDELSKAKLLMQILVCNLAITFPSSVFDSIISAHEQFLFQRVLTLLGNIFNPIICLPLLLSGYGSVAIVVVTTLITLLKFIINGIFCLKVLHIHFVFNHFDFHLLKEIFAFSFFLLLNMIIDQINWSIDKFILGRVSGTGAVAIYGVGSQLNSVFLSFSTVISSVFSPRINRIAAEQSPNAAEEFTSLFIKVGRIQFVVVALVASGFLFFGKYFITSLYAGPEYVESYYVALWLMLPMTVPLMQNLGIEIQRSLNKHQYRSIVYFVMALLNMLISIPLAKLYGPIGSAAGTGMSTIISTWVLMNIYYYKEIKIDIIAFGKSILQLSKGLIIPIIAVLFMKHIVDIQNIKDFFMCVVLYIFVYVISFWKFGINKEEKALALKPIQKICGRRHQKL